MKRKTLAISLTLLLAIAFSAPVYAIPQYIDYQGKLIDNQTGNPMTGAVIIDFRIWNAASGGSVNWSAQEIINLVEDDNGLFAVTLGPIAESVFDGTDHWLGIEVESDGEMTPRKQIVSVPYAYRAYSAATADTATSAITAINANYATTASNLGGQPASNFLNTSSTTQVKLGGLEVSYLKATDDTISAANGIQAWENVIFYDNLTVYDDLLVKGHLTVMGSKNAIVPLENGEIRKMYSVESPESWFEDFGSAKLTDGKSVIKIDQMFSQTVNTGKDYHVFITPKGNCKGLYITHTKKSSFEVRELGEGKSNIEFDYRIVAKRKGYEDERMAKVFDDNKVKDEEERENLARAEVNETVKE